jgi:hypothetical protein
MLGRCRCRLLRDQPRRRAGRDRRRHRQPARTRSPTPRPCSTGLRAQIAEGEAEAGRILGEAREHAAALAQHSEVVRVANEQAAQLLADAEEEAAALRRETDEFIDQRMAGFESVLHKTASQVKTARLRLAERSGLDGFAQVDHRALAE